MGYSHAWGYMMPVDDPGAYQDEWSRALIAAARLVAASPIPLGDYTGSGNPEMSDSRLAFNGAGADAFESIDFPTRLADADGGFCKTGERPYDLIVTAVLATLEHYAPHCFLITSTDGFPSQWVAGVKLARQVLDDPTIPLPLATLDASVWSDEVHGRFEADSAAALAALSK